MNTPICDFVQKYAESGTLRLHMPGHKGVGGQNERVDITEISGADSLYEADGIICESERNASGLFGAHTFYSTEGSSLCIRAMLYLVCVYAAEKGEKTLIAAGRNAHKTFVSAAALLDLDVDWLLPPGASYLSCPISAEYVRNYLDSCPKIPTALYLTSPDYLGNTVDVAAISAVCRERGVLLLVDNAHGAYLKFLPSSRHPIDLGADMCCDSAHKTLPALTGAAYLHVSTLCPDKFRQFAIQNVRHALSLFGSTSPSYLILASLDRVNSVLDGGYREAMSELITKIDALKLQLTACGFALVGDEPLKLTVAPKSYGYTGYGLADHLRKNGIEPEFCDADHLVLMFTPALSTDATLRLQDAFTNLPRREAINSAPPQIYVPRRFMSIREAVMSPCELLDVENCLGRVAACVTVGCPPAVPVVVSGEVIDEYTVAAMNYYGIDKCSVVK